MEPLSESAIGSWFSAAARRKRSDSRRRPHPDPKPVNHFPCAFTLSVSPLDYRGRENTYLNSSQVLEPERQGNERKVKKLKLKLGGVTRTLHTKSSTYDTSGAHKTQPQASSSMDFNYKNTFVLKNNQVTKKHAFDDGFDEDEDEEIRYLKKLRASKVASGNGDRQDDELKGIRDTEDFADLAGSGQEMTMTTRKRALKCPDSGGLLEFPNGLPEAPSKKQKLTEVQHQLRKAELAQRRKLQSDRAAKEAEAEAIKRILGQDSSRKKKEDKQKKKQEDIAQEKTDMAATLRPNTVRLSMGQNGTIVTFSEDLGLPKIFNSPTCRYPPPREKCVGPNCTNVYKYRDSKSKLPLCSLDCYKAVQGNSVLTSAC